MRSGMLLQMRIIVALLFIMVLETLMKAFMISWVWNHFVVPHVSVTRLPMEPVIGVLLILSMLRTRTGLGQPFDWTQIQDRAFDSALGTLFGVLMIQIITMLF